MYYLKQYFSAFCKQAIIDKIDFIYIKKKAPRGQVSFPWLKNDKLALFHVPMKNIQIN